MHNLRHYQYPPLQWYICYNWCAYTDTLIITQKCIIHSASTWCCIFCGFGQACDDMGPLLYYPMESLAVKLYYLFIISTYLVFRQMRSLFCSVLFSLNHAKLPICHFSPFFFFTGFHSCTLYRCMGCCELFHQPLEEWVISVGSCNALTYIGWWGCSKQHRPDFCPQGAQSLCP